MDLYFSIQSAPHWYCKKLIDGIHSNNFRPTLWSWRLRSFLQSSNCCSSRNPDFPLCSPLMIFPAIELVQIMTWKAQKPPEVLKKFMLHSSRDRDFTTGGGDIYGGNLWVAICSSQMEETSWLASTSSSTSRPLAFCSCWELFEVPTTGCNLYIHRGFQFPIRNLCFWVYFQEFLFFFPQVL